MLDCGNRDGTGANLALDAAWRRGVLAESRRDGQNRGADKPSSTRGTRFASSLVRPPAREPIPAERRRMIPLRDDNPAQRAPVVTRLLIVANVIVFVYELSLGEALPEFLRDWGIVPGR